MIQFTRDLLEYLTLFSHILVVFILAAYVFWDKRKILAFIRKYALQSSFSVALIATLGSLFYSDVAGFEPCLLCWYQRIFMYPQTVLFGMAITKRDKKIADYGIALSAIGGVIALYHVLLQRNLLPNIACDAVGYSVSCSKEFITAFGYITIPVMSVTAFGLILIALIALKTSKAK